MKKTQDAMDAAQKISDALENVGDDLLEDADAKRTETKAGRTGKLSREKLWKIGAGCAAVLCIGAVGITALSRSPLKTFALAEAEYPEQAQYSALDIGSARDNWLEQRRERYHAAEDKTGTLWSFVPKGSFEVLADADGENRVWSPAGVYMALGMLAETSGGNARQQILDLFSCDMETLRDEANAIWRANYSDDGAVYSAIGTSLWLDEHLDYDTSVVESLADTYYTSTYRGRMGSESFDRAFRAWINDQTNSQQREQTKALSLNPYPDNVFALVSTVSYEAKWGDKFKSANTKAQTFHAPTGDLVCDFMHKDLAQKEYYYGNTFGAVSEWFECGGTMWFILPDEDRTPADVLADEDFWSMLQSGYGNYEKHVYRKVNLAVPKFDIRSSLDLKSDIMTLGVTDVFNAERAEFSLITDDTPAWISAVLHSARVSIDEDGCRATSFVVLPGAGAAPPPEEIIDFVCDRPFLFVITGTNDIPLFIGVVNQP